jgi:TPR repeat protein
MLRQNPPHVKTLPTGIKNAENGIHAQAGDSGPPLFMSIQQKFVRFVVVIAVAAAVASAQTDDFATLRQKAESGDPKAQFDLASAYSLGTGVPKDSAKGLEWLRKSAAEGYAGAEVVLGFFYQKGIGIESDPSEAAKWYRKAAQQGDKDPKHAETAKNHLSEMLSQGLISAKDADWHASERSSTTAKQPKTNKPSPFSLGEVETGLSGGITSKRMATLVSTYGVDFILSADTRKRLTDKGADDTLLATIASAKR